MFDSLLLGSQCITRTLGLRSTQFENSRVESRKWNSKHHRYWGFGVFGKGGGGGLSVKFLNYFHDCFWWDDDFLGLSIGSDWLRFVFFFVIPPARAPTRHLGAWEVSWPQRLRCSRHGRRWDRLVPWLEGVFRKFQEFEISSHFLVYLCISWSSLAD